MLINLIPVALGALYALAAIFAYQSLHQARTAQGAMGWVLFLAAVPVIAVPFYLVLGQTRFPRRRARRRELRGIVMRLHGIAERHPPTANEEGGHGARTRAFEEIAGVPLLSGNRAELLIDGPDTFAAIFAAIDAAESYVLVSFYTIRDDALGRQLHDRLCERARAGLCVRVLYDSVGSSLTKSYMAKLRAAGAEISDFNANRMFRSRFQLNFRNHRKMVVVDGSTAFLGGHNVGEEYLGTSARYGAWRDTHVRIIGPVVAEIQLSFAEDWLWAAGEELKLHWSPPRQPGGMDALIVAPGPADRIESGSLYFCNAIGAAQDRLWIATPYFVPDTDILSALKLAALRGADVRILMPSEPDQWTPWLAAHAYFDEIREAGVQIWRYGSGFMHQKVLLIDDDIASIGSINLDNRSCRLNFEITLIGTGAEFAGRVRDMLEADFAKSTLFETPLAKNPRWLVRHGAMVARLFAPVL